MAVTKSGLYYPTWADMVDTTQLAVDLDLETHKGSLFNNSITPNFNTDTAYAVAPYNANEVTGTNWPSGGIALVGTVVVNDSGTEMLVFDATDVSVASVTVVSARAYLLYADVLAGNNAIFLLNFGADYSATNGTFAIQWATAGIFGIDLA